MMFALERLLTSCDVFILSSRSEACLIVVLEAMAMGCKVVASDVGDVSAMLKSCPRAWIFQPESIPGFVDAPSAANRFANEDLGLDSLDYIGEDWRIDNIGDRIASVYKELLK